jgi:hypothetical protein
MASTAIAEIQTINFERNDRRESTGHTEIFA